VFRKIDSSWSIWTFLWQILARLGKPRIGIVEYGLEVSKRGLSNGSKGGVLVRREPIVIEEITAHPPNFAQLVIFVACECRYVALFGAHEGIIQIIFRDDRIWMQGRTERQRLENGFD
jgi:hypothetical protein